MNGHEEIDMHDTMKKKITIAFPFCLVFEFIDRQCTDDGPEWKKKSSGRALASFEIVERKEFAYICNVSGLRVFSLICLLLICPTWKFSGGVLSVRCVCGWISISFTLMLCIHFGLRGMCVYAFFPFSRR